MYRIGAIIAAVMLVLALAPLPYGYYQVLRIVVCGIAAYGAYLAYASEASTWMWVLGGIAVLFNPILPTYLDRTIWNVIDLITAVGLMLSTRTVSETPST